MGRSTYSESSKSENNPESAVGEKAVVVPILDINSHDGLQQPQLRLGSLRDSTSNQSAQSSTCLNEIKFEVMVNYLYQQQCANLWIYDKSGEIEGILLRKHKSTYMSYPPQLSSSSFATACAALNVQCAMTVNSRVIKSFFERSPDAVSVPLLNGLSIQILPTIEDLPRARKHQFAAFIATQALLIVWDDEALNLVQRARQIESELMELIWKAGNFKEDEKKESDVGFVEIDEESGQAKPEKRPLNLQNTVLVTLTLIFVMTTLGAGFRQLAIEVAIDGVYTRLLLLLLTPIQVFLPSSLLKSL
ncbi:putative nucleotide-diphospho-sugar transferase [Golovinomyces cichoracearum]|uniref:Putative nucleotide-diphospho-sugar transferase n=1 Tax=Golovinomyces cichoracearum TaxID=62708 RepID=A0A420IZ88_9PEZI|nr:putative nucleotide-diphospho-sugar transferase [Golovinomyces cichoracearum]